MKPPLALAEKLQLLAAGGQLPASQLKHPLVAELLEEGILTEVLSGRTKSTYRVPNPTALKGYLENRWAIPSLTHYIAALRDADTSRATLVAVSADSKTRALRTFSGFLVHSYLPIQATLHGLPYTIHPPDGAFQFVYDYSALMPPPNAVVVGVENAENFRHIARQQHLFPGMVPLFVSRYPQGQSKDLLKWLLSIPNSYLHFGDFDFAGINIYQQEFKKHLGPRATFFLPPNLEQLLANYGNHSLYDQQQLNQPHTITEPGLLQLIALLHTHKKGLEQEALLIEG